MEDKKISIITTTEPKIRFIPDGHRYIDETTGKELISTTTWLKRFFPVFDAEHWGKIKADQEGISKEEMLARWKARGKASTDLGTAVHNYAENVIMNRPLPVPIGQKQREKFAIINKFLEETDLKPIYAERIIGSPRLGIAGTVDMELLDEQGRLFLGDWKTNESIDLFNKYGSFALPPIEKEHDCNYVKYALQMSLYRFILELEYKRKVHGQQLVWVRDFDYHVFTPDYMEDAILRMLRHEKRL